MESFCLPVWELELTTHPQSADLQLTGLQFSCSIMTSNDRFPKASPVGRKGAAALWVIPLIPSKLHTTAVTCRSNELKLQHWVLPSGGVCTVRFSGNQWPRLVFHSERSECSQNEPQQRGEEPELLRGLFGTMKFIICRLLLCVCLDFYFILLPRPVTLNPFNVLAVFTHYTSREDLPFGKNKASGLHSES